MTERSPTTGPFLTEAAVWTEGVYQWQADDVILGGPDGNDNWPTQALANRTKYLKQELESGSGALAEHAASNNHPLATTDAKGMVVLATVAQAMAGALNNVVVTPDGLAAAVQAGLDSLVGAAPGTLNTLDEIAAALGDDPNAVTTIMAALAGKAPLASPEFTGAPKVPTAAPGTSTDQAASTAFVTDALSTMPSRAGEIIYIASTTPPAGALKANGATVSRTTYAALFAAIGTTFGVGDGATTFALPDLRGEFIRGWDDARGVDSGRVFGSAQTDAFQGHRHAITSVVTFGTGSAMGGARPLSDGPPGSGWVGDPVTDGVSGTPRIAAETRPRNVALLACIRYQ